MVKLLPFDLETFSAKDRHVRSDFVRLAGYRLDGDVAITTSGDEVVRYLEDTNRVAVGHNICAFDLVVLARHHGLRLPDLLGRVVDTDTLARLIDPAPSGKDGVIMRPKGYYGLDETSGRFGLEGKTDNLKEIAKEFKGFDNIPADDERFQDYLRGDVRAHEQLFKAMRYRDEVWPGFWKYAAREMRVGLLTAQMTVNGLRVDVPEIERALVDQGARKVSNLLELQDYTGLSLEGTAPLSSGQGKYSVVGFFRDQGVRDQDIPRTPKGAYSISGKEVLALAEKVRKDGGNQHVERVCQLVSEIVSERTIYQTANDSRIDDRVYPQIKAIQASGRWSVTDPGLTVFGKRGGKHVERRIVLPDEGHSLISIDLDQIDQRAIAAHSQDENYMAIFQEGRDLHGWLAEKIFGSLEFREKVKPVIHGWTYGRSVKAIIKDGVDPDVAQKFDEEMRKDYAGIIRWQDKVRTVAAAGGLLDNGYGRKMRSDPRFAFTQAPALVGQGCARDLLAEGLLRMPLEFWPFLRVIVHDEIVASVPTEDAEEIGREMVKAMTFDFKGVPITSGCSKPGRNWADVYAK